MKEKKKGIGIRPIPWESAVKQESFSHPGNPHLWLEDQPGQKGSVRGSEESAATGLWQAGQRETSTVMATLLHSPAWDMHLLVCAGAGCWNSGFRGQTWGEDWGWLCGDSPKRLECGPGHNLGYAQDWAQVCHRSPIVNAHAKGEKGLCHSSLIFLIAHSRHNSTSTSSGSLQVLAVAHTQRQGWNLGLQLWDWWIYNTRAFISSVPSGHLSGLLVLLSLGWVQI